MPKLKYEKQISIGLIFLSFFMFLVIMMRLYGSMGDVSQGDRFLLCFLYSLFYLGIVGFFFITKRSKHILVLAAIAFFTATIFAARFVVLPSTSDDMTRFIWTWIRQMRRYDGLSYLASDFTSNYNIPYLTAVLGIAKLSLSRMSTFFLLKYISILFDVIAAYFIMRIVGIFHTKYRIVPILSFFAALLVPTLLLNSAYWGQCDSMYVACCLGAVYYGLAKRSKACYIIAAVAFAFKIQAIFVFPALLIFLLVGKIRFRDCYLFPVTYLILMLPAFISGKGLMDTLTIYFHQTDEISILAEGVPNIYMLFIDGGQRIVDGMGSTFGIFLTGTFCLAAAFYAFYYRNHLNSGSLLRLALITAIIIPYCLPHMHDRYFLFADLLSLVFAFAFPKKWYYSAIIIGASYNAYSYYLWRTYLWHYKYFALGLLIVLALLVREVILETKSFYVDEEDLVKEAKPVEKKPKKVLASGRK